MNINNTCTGQLMTSIGRNMQSQVCDIFCLGFSILTTAATLRGRTTDTCFKRIANTVTKIIQNGHACTFTYKKVNKITKEYENFLLIEPGPDGFLNSRENGNSIGNTTESATTYIYWIESPGIFKRYTDYYEEICNEMLKANNPKRIYYSWYKPNLLGGNHYENCVSLANRITYDLNPGKSRDRLRWITSTGFWTPSASNWASWLSTWMPSGWSYVKIDNWNLWVNPNREHLHLE